MSKKSSKSSKKKKVTGLPGQARPEDSSAAVFWHDNRRFAEIFSKTAMKDCPIDPDELVEQDTTEAALIRIMGNINIPLKQVRDVVKALKSGVQLAVLGIENYTYIDYLLPFHILTSDYLNIAKQVSTIKNANRQNKSNHTKGEVMSLFNRSDKIAPVVTLAIYYGKEPWDGPTKLSDLYIDSPYKQFAADYPIYVLDVRRMTDEQIDDFSDDLKTLFSFLKYEGENTDKLVEFVLKNRSYFGSVHPETLSALIEITKSKELLYIQKESRNPEGRIDMCNGIQYYANQVAKEQARQTFIETAQDFGHSITDTINKFVTKFNVTEEEAQADIKKYWKES